MLTIIISVSHLATNIVNVISVDAHEAHARQVPQEDVLGLDLETRVVIKGDPLVPDPDQTLVPEGVVAFTSFEQATLGATTFQFSGIEMGWQTTTTGEVGIRSEIVGVPLPNQALVVHNSALTWTSDIVAISNPEAVIATVAARVYQESTGIESEDFIDIRMQISGDGMAFVDLPHFLSIEGTRLGPSGGTRTPLEDALNVDTAADADWWMGWIIHVDGGARDPRVPTLFQVADCDTGHVRWISADEATRLATRLVGC